MCLAATHVVVICHVICWHPLCFAGTARQIWSIAEHWPGHGTGSLPIFNDTWQARAATHQAGAPSPAAGTASSDTAPEGQQFTILAWAGTSPVVPAVAMPLVLTAGGVSVKVAQVSVTRTPRRLLVSTGDLEGFWGHVL